MGSNLGVIDLKTAYMQLQVDPELWKYQLVRYKGKVYALTHLGFGLNVAPKIMSAVIKFVLARDPSFIEATDSFVDDIIVDLNRVSNQQVLSVFESYGLLAKPAEKLYGGRVL